MSLNELGIELRWLAIRNILSIVVIVVVKGTIHCAL